MAGGPFRRAVILTGTTGIGFDALLERAKRLVGPGCVDKFESHLTLGPCGDVEQYVHYLYVSGVEAKSRFREALDSMVKSLESRGCKDVVIAMHFTYMAGYSITPNPVVPEVLRIAEDVRVVSVVDDWYDVIVRVAGRALEGGACERRELGYTIDPETVVNWRAADLSLASLSEEMGATRWYLLAVKHPPEVLDRLLEELLGRKRYLKAYISHPIRPVRGLYAEVKCLAASRRGCEGLDRLDLGRFPLVSLIEGFKSYVREVLERGEGAILFEPTTIDELLVDAKCTGGTCRPERVLMEPRPGLRWPSPAGGAGEGLEALRSAFTALRGEKLDSYVYALSRPEDLGKASQALSYILVRFAEALEEQVEARDYKYIEQSDVLVAAVPSLLYCGERGEPAISPMPSRGVSDEVRRAMALSKPIYFYVLPVDVDALSRALLDYAGLPPEDLPRVKELAAKAFAAGGGGTGCSRAPATDEVAAAAASMASGVFPEVPLSARVIVMPVIREPEVLASPGAVKRLYEESKPLAVSPRSA